MSLCGSTVQEPPLDDESVLPYYPDLYPLGTSPETVSISCRWDRGAGGSVSVAIASLLCIWTILRRAAHTDDEQTMMHTQIFTVSSDADRHASDMNRNPRASSVHTASLMGARTWHALAIPPGRMARGGRQQKLWPRPSSPGRVGAATPSRSRTPQD